MAIIKRFVGLVLVVTAGSSAALNIGMLRGSAWIEQPLNVVVPIQRDTANETDGLCPSAEVAYADSTLEMRRVNLVQEPNEAGDVVRLRVSTSVPVNEAYVSIVVQVGCTRKVSRRFVLLTDFPQRAELTSGRSAAAAEVPTVEPSAASAPATAASGTATTLPADATTSDTSGSASGGTVAPTATTTVSAAPSAVPGRATPPPVRAKPRSKPRPPEAVAVPEKKPEGSRLKLDAVQVSPQKIRQLESASPAEPSSPAATPAAETASEPALAASEREEQQKLRADLQWLQMQAAKNELEFAALRKRLEEAESDRSIAIIAAATGFALLLALAVAALLWMGRRERERSALAPSSELDPDEEKLVADFNPVDADKWTPASKADAGVSVEEVDLPLPVDEPPKR